VAVIPVSTVAWDITGSDGVVELHAGEGARYKRNDVLMNIRTREQFLALAVEFDRLRIIRGIAYSQPLPMYAGDRVVKLKDAWEAVGGNSEVM
jgi:hypothetical protein